MHGDVRVLSGVYSISFLSVMGLFAVGDALLKVYYFCHHHRHRQPYYCRYYHHHHPHPHPPSPIPHHTALNVQYKRDALPRAIRAHWKTILSALLLVCVSLLTTILNDLRMFRFFIYYFAITAAVVSFMFYRFELLKILIFFSRLALKVSTLGIGA